MTVRHRLITALGAALFVVACGPSQTVPTNTAGPSQDDTAGVPTAEPGSSTGSAKPTPPATTAVDTTLGSSTDDGGGFVPEHDRGSDQFECDLFKQNCPLGQKCMPWANDGGGAWNATRCVPIADDPGQPGDPCTVMKSNTSGLDDCELGAMCWNVEPRTLNGTCIAMCTGSRSNPFCEDPDTYCAISSDGAILPCLFQCNPLLQNCPRGQACYPINDNWTCAPDASERAGAYGDPCEFINVCDPGLICLNAASVPDCAGAQGCCSEVCDLSDPAGDAQCMGAPEGQICLAWWEEGDEPAGLDEVGACSLPL